jgi:hypothetical protein
MPIKKKNKKERYEYYGFPPITKKKKIISMKEILDGDINTVSKISKIKKIK